MRGAVPPPRLGCTPESTGGGEGPLPPNLHVWFWAPTSYILVPDSGNQITDFGVRICDLGDQIIDSGAGIYDLGAQIIDSGARVYELAAQIMDFGTQIYDLGIKS